MAATPGPTLPSPVKMDASATFGDLEPLATSLGIGSSTPLASRGGGATGGASFHGNASTAGGGGFGVSSIAAGSVSNLTGVSTLRMPELPKLPSMNRTTLPASNTANTSAPIAARAKATSPQKKHKGLTFGRPRSPAKAVPLMGHQRGRSRPNLNANELPPSPPKVLARLAWMLVVLGG